MEAALAMFVLAIAVALAIDIGLAYFFGKMAGRKGHNGVAFGILVFFLGLVGMIIVALLPDKVRAEREARQMEALTTALQQQAVRAAGPTAQSGYAALPADAGLPDPQKGVLPGERYEQLLVDDRLYTEGSPVLILASALVKDRQTGAIIVQVKFKSLSDKEIEAVIIDVSAEDITGGRLPGVEGFQYLDLGAVREDVFGSKVPVHMPDTRTRSFDISIRKVVFTDLSSWEPGARSEWLDAPPRQRLKEVLGDSGLIEQYRRDTYHMATYVPEQFSDLWFCTCRGTNRNDEGTCCRCGLARSLVFGSLDLTGLGARLAQYREEEWREQQERDLAERKRAEDEKKKNIIWLAVVAFIVVLLAAAYFYWVW